MSMSFHYTPLYNSPEAGKYTKEYVWPVSPVSPLICSYDVNAYKQHGTEPVLVRKIHMKSY